jgi:hypothetical protein
VGQGSGAATTIHNANKPCNLTSFETADESLSSVRVFPWSLYKGGGLLSPLLAAFPAKLG